MDNHLEFFSVLFFSLFSPNFPLHRNSFCVFVGRGRQRKTRDKNTVV